MKTEIYKLSALELSEAYKNKSLSPVEATYAILDRIKNIDKKLNAYVFIDEDLAINQARESEIRWNKGNTKSKIDGVPTAIKDLLLTTGWPSLRGSKTVNKNSEWKDDAPVTARLKESGAVLIGKTTTPEFGHKGTTQSPLTGITRNPWNVSRTSGGSSGGSSSSVSSGMGPLAIGTDGGGSVRIPCSFTGLFGIKPTFGKVPAWPLSPFGTIANVGPMTRTVHDGA
jgi:aspartyl-tRNA(Asn)/glutamyl-tRNA(Gln) amidotransferase subunit A